MGVQIAALKRHFSALPTSAGLEDSTATFVLPHTAVLQGFLNLKTTHDDNIPPGSPDNPCPNYPTSLSAATDNTS
jgi:hypothetical protein